MKLRILIATHAPLSAEFGAAQVALNLGQALRKLGHEVTLWSPQPLRARGRWLGNLNAMRRGLSQFIAKQTAFDIIDAPASLCPWGKRHNALLVARSVQPDLRYLALELPTALRFSPFELLRLIDRLLQFIYHAFLVLLGWQRADLIVCLGHLELEWMRRRFPFLSGKLRYYPAALSNSDQRQLSALRIRRGRPDPARGVRFLWIGRWARHKGTTELVSFAVNWFARRPQDRLTIAGCGKIPSAAIPVELIRSGQVCIVPEFARNQLVAILEAHDFGLFTSKVEGWGLSLNEMLESGMPVYASNAGGAPDLASQVPGLIRPFPPSEGNLSPGDAADCDWTGYYRSFSWLAIAAKYLEATMSGGSSLHDH